MRVDTFTDRMVVKVACPRCRKVQTLVVDRTAYAVWKAGALVQNAFPDLTPDQREVLVTGICPVCWDAMFKDC